MILLQQVQELQVAYGAVLLSFLGAIHWGFEVCSLLVVLPSTSLLTSIS